VKRLAGIGKRLTEAEIRERLRIGQVNDRYVLIAARSAVDRENVTAASIHHLGRGNQGASAANNTSGTNLST